jgi:hypothetical protein
LERARSRDHEEIVAGIEALSGKALLLVAEKDEARHRVWVKPAEGRRPLRKGGPCDPEVGPDLLKQALKPLGPIDVEDFKSPLGDPVGRIGKSRLAGIIRKDQ